MPITDNHDFHLDRVSYMSLKPEFDIMLDFFMLCFRNSVRPRVRESFVEGCCCSAKFSNGAVFLAELMGWPAECRVSHNRLLDLGCLLAKASQIVIEIAQTLNLLFET